MTDKASISFLGDIALVGEYNQLYEKGIDPFGEISQELLNKDLVIGNLECLSEGKEGENLKKKPRLKTSRNTLTLLNKLNLGLATLGHNHVYDNLLDGFVQTTSFLKENNIQFLGAGTSQDEAEKPVLKAINNINFCFLNYVTSDTNPNLPIDSKVFLNLFNLDKVRKDINEYRNNVDFIILLLHWGGRLEGGNYPDNDQPSIAKQILDFGADLIIGHHSHTLQPFEVYKGKYIFYSLGNFCFADFISDGKLRKMRAKNTRNSIIVNVDFEKSKYTVDCSFIKNNNFFIQYDNTFQSKYNSRNRIFKLQRKIRLFWVIYFYKVKYFNRLIRIIQNRILN